MTAAMATLLSPADRPPADTIVLEVCTAKNAILPLLIASLLNAERTRFVTSKAFSLTDADAVVALLSSVGAVVTVGDDIIEVDARNLHTADLPRAAASHTRYSLLMLGALLARSGEASAPTPGGCDLGRPHDFHVQVLRALGCSVKEESGVISAVRTCPAQPIVTLPYPSVGATINAILCASTSRPVTGDTITLENCATEPEIDDVIAYLGSIGIGVERRWRTIIVNPVAKLHGVAREHTPIRDRIEAGSYALAAAILGVKAIVRHAPVSLMDSVLMLLLRLGCQVTHHGGTLVVDGRKIDREIGLVVSTEPYPGLPTDIQPILAALCACQNASSQISDTVMPKRTRYLEALRYLGANVDARGAIISVVPFARSSLAGHATLRVSATDLRGGMAAILFALRRGVTCRIDNFSQVRRGYSQVEKVIEAMGGSISECP